VGREVLAVSPGGLEVEVVSVAARDNPVVSRYGALPLHERPGMFVSARVHPGETPASHVMNGLMKAFLEKDPVVEQALSLYTFYLVPMINPEGVAKGHYRASCLGENLNRHYENPCPDRQP
jgi:murein tripeptide amidase MpaA